MMFEQEMKLSNCTASHQEAKAEGFGSIIILVEGPIYQQQKREGILLWEDEPCGKPWSL